MRAHVGKVLSTQLGVYGGQFLSSSFPPIPFSSFLLIMRSHKGVRPVLYSNILCPAQQMYMFSTEAHPYMHVCTSMSAASAHDS